jgi:hypothetical protein
MTVSRRKGDAGKADLLYSRLVRSRGQCERCGNDAGPFDTAHIVRRRYSATRCLEDNAWCLCRPCHRTVDEWANELMWQVERTIGVPRYKELCKLAQSGTGMTSKLFWKQTRNRLEERCKELGIPTTWKAQ